MELIVKTRHGYFNTQDEHEYPTKEAALASMQGYEVVRETPYIIALTNPDDDCPF